MKDKELAMRVLAGGLGSFIGAGVGATANAFMNDKGLTKKEKEDRARRASWLGFTGGAIIGSAASHIMHKKYSDKMHQAVHNKSLKEGALQYEKNHPHKYHYNEGELADKYKREWRLDLDKEHDNDPRVLGTLRKNRAIKEMVDISKENKYKPRYPDIDITKR